MEPIEQAHHELDRLQGIIDRHEGHMFALRGWLLAIIGGLLAAYYTENIDLGATLLRAALLLVVVLFLILESRHVNLVEAVVERATRVEEAIRQRDTASTDQNWYDGPRVGEACLAGAKRILPKSGMTFFLNQWFYVAVVLVIVVTTVALPPKHIAASKHAAEKSSGLPDERTDVRSLPYCPAQVAADDVRT
ncbi:MAG TPA: hypothetical protein VMW56_06375 [Candidatus Margulisiibacteriota bacterium]|nr:hypothetical protein [Candidatus Margulisiibacteriota bacterium]